MSGSIGDVFFRLIADASGLTADVTKAGEDAGDKAAKSFGTKFNAAAKTLLTGALAGGFAIATKGLLDLDSATARYRATTGATQADVEKMQSTVLELNRHNLENIDQITDLLSVLRTDLGLTQDEADAAAQSFLDFAHATGGDAVTAAKQFDDILDAWGLTAQDATGIMDKLVASHQKYGGSIDENSQALATLAPQLKALGTDVDGAIGLLNLFASSGIDASKATAALNTAVGKLKPGQTIDDLIKQISSIEDPTLRAQAAIDAFGARGGVALANALKPGVTGLADFEVSAGDAAGATKKAADEINDSIENKIKLAIKDFGGAFIELMAQGGPVVQFLSFGVPLVVGGIKLIGETLTREAAAAGLKWAALLGPLAITAAATAAAVNEVTKARDLDTASARAAADQQGGLYGAMARQSIAQREAREAAAAMNSTLQEQQRAALLLSERLDDLAGHGQSRGGSWGAVGAAAGVGAAGVTFAASAMTDALLGPEQALRALPPMARIVGSDTLQKLADGIKSARQAPLDAFDALIEAMKKPLTETAETARVLGELASKQLAKGLASGDPAIRAQAAATKQAIIERLDELNPSLGTLSKKAMDSLAAGLKSKDDDVRAAAERIAMVIEAQLALKNAKLWAQHAAEAYADGFTSRGDYLAEQVRVFQSRAQRTLIAYSPPKEGPLKEIDKWGERTGLAWVDAFIAALETSIGKTDITLSKVKKAVTSFISSYSPIGGLFGGLTPEADRANLTKYIADLRAQLPKETDPTKRLEIVRQIAEYEGRLADLQGKNATKNQETAQTIQGYINNLDKALLTATDPKRIKAITDELVKWIAALDKVLHPEPGKAKPAPEPQSPADGQGGHYERRGNSWVWVNADGTVFDGGMPAPADSGAYSGDYRDTLVRDGHVFSTSTGQDLGTFPSPDAGAPQVTATSYGAAADAAARQINVTVINPAPEPAGRSVTQVLKLRSAFDR